MKLIDKDPLVAKINRILNSYDPNEITSGRYALVDLRNFIDTLEVKEVYVSNPRFPHLKDIIDKVFGAGNLEFWEYDDAEQLVLLAKDEVISRACKAAGMKKPYKDGNQWCILKGENIQEGICSFGDNIEDALVDFLRNIPKIPLEVKEVDLERELNEYGLYYDYTSFDRKEIIDFAKHFFELGMAVNNKAQKRE